MAYELVGSMRKANPDIEMVVLTTAGSNCRFEKPIIFSNKLRLLFHWRKIRQIFRQSDLIHALDGFPYGFIATFLSFGLKRKKIITLVGSGSIKPLYNFWQFFLVKWAYKKADKLTAISSYTAQEVKKMIPDLEIEVINLGINLDRFLFQKADQEIAKSGRYILSVGRLKPRKGYLESIKVFSEVNKHFPDLKYVIVGSGDGKYFQKMLESIKNLNLTDKVIFKKNISDDDLVSLYQGAELFILLSQNDNYDIEGFGLVFLEAAAFGLPVISSKNCGAQDAILDKENGFLVDPKNLREAAESILLILNNQSLRERFSEKSKKFAKQMSWQKVVVKYADIYRSLL